MFRVFDCTTSKVQSSRKYRTTHFLSGGKLASIFTVCNFGALSTAYVSCSCPIFLPERRPWAFTVEAFTFSHWLTLGGDRERGTDAWPAVWTPQIPNKLENCAVTKINTIYWSQKEHCCTRTLVRYYHDSLKYQVDQTSFYNPAKWEREIVAVLSSISNVLGLTIPKEVRVVYWLL